MDHSKKLTHLSLCTGYGGIDLGLKRALNNVRTVAYVEIETFQCANLVSKMEKCWLDAAPIWTNLKTFPWANFRGKVDVLSGGFPCQPFSAVGRRRGDEDPRHLWPHIKRGIEIIRPPIIFMENVEGIISSKLQSDQWSDPQDTSVLLHVLRELERLGYKATAGIFSASEIGAPHQRKRIFIMGLSPTLANSDCIRSWTGTEFTDEKRESLAGRRQSIPTERNSKNHDATASSFGYRTAYPASRGAEQYSLEPPRTIYEKTQSEMGRDANGAAHQVDYAELYESCDSRTDELRSLGNGVVPDTAAKAFLILSNELSNKGND